jgi:DNA-directed RNA polymerase specialized sigma24 family protein
VDKIRYVLINGEKIYVTEEVYRAYYRPIWREAKQRKVQAKMEFSLNALTDSGVDVASSEAPIDEVVLDKLTTDKLRVVLDILDEDERGLIYALFFQGKSERDISAESDTPRTTISYRKKRLLAFLKKNL